MPMSRDSPHDVAVVLPCSEEEEANGAFAQSRGQEGEEGQDPMGLPWLPGQRLHNRDVSWRCSVPSTVQGHEPARWLFKPELQGQGQGQGLLLSPISLSVYGVFAPPWCC